MPVNFIFDDVKKEFYSLNKYAYKKVKFDGSEEDFKTFYKEMFKAFDESDYENLYMDKIYNDVFDPDNFETIKLSADESKVTFKFKDVKTMRDYKLKLLDFKEYIDRPTKKYK